MNLMLAVIFLCVGIGLFAPRLGTRENVVIGGIGVVMALLYLFQPMRFM
jgi:hypothetical protein